MIDNIGEIRDQNEENENGKERDAAPGGDQWPDQSVSRIQKPRLPISSLEFKGGSMPEFAKINKYILLSNIMY